MNKGVEVESKSRNQGGVGHKKADASRAGMNLKK